MKTYNKGTREDIRKAINEALLVKRSKDYADTLVGYFCEKVEAWMTAVRTGSEKWEKEAERKYGTQTGKPRYELETAMDDLKTVLRWREEIDHYVDCAVAQEWENPIKYSYNEKYITEQDADAEYQSSLRFRHHDTLHVYDLLNLYNHTHGLKDEEYNELLDYYDVR